MDRSRLPSERAIGSVRDETASNTPGIRLPLIIISILTIGGIWFFQQASLRHLNDRIYQFGQDIDKLPNRSLTPVDRASLEKDLIVRERSSRSAMVETDGLQVPTPEIICRVNAPEPKRWGI